MSEFLRDVLNKNAAVLQHIDQITQETKDLMGAMPDEMLTMSLSTALNTSRDLTPTIEGYLGLSVHIQSKEFKTLTIYNACKAFAVLIMDEIERRLDKEREATDGQASS